MTQDSFDFAGQPIHDPAAESALLGSMLLSVDAVIDALDICTADDLYNPLHQQLFALMSAMFQRGAPIDATTVTAEATTAGLHERINNGAYLYDLLNRTPAVASTTYYATLVRDKARLRRIAQALLRAYQQTQTPSVDAANAPGIIASDILATIDDATAPELTHVKDAVANALDTSIGIRDGLITRTYYTTGYPELDALLTGIHPGQLIILAGRPGMGKSVATVDICRHIAITLKQPVLLFSLEMTKEEISSRIASAISGVPLQNIREARLTHHEEATVRAALQQLDDAPLYIQDSTHRTLADIRAAALSLKRRLGSLALIAVDYLQLLDPPNPNEPKAIQAEETSRALKLLARDIAPVLAASQLNRKLEDRADKRPVLADIRWGGENDTDIAIGIHREDIHDPHSPRAGEVDLLVLKHRNGPTGEVPLAAQLSCTRFVSMFADTR